MSLHCLRQMNAQAINHNAINSRVYFHTVLSFHSSSVYSAGVYVKLKATTDPSFLDATICKNGIKGYIIKPANRLKRKNGSYTNLKPDWRLTTVVLGLGSMTLYSE